MAEKISPIVYRGIHRGMVDEEAVQDNQLEPQTYWRLIRNMNADIIGSPKRRKGYSRLGSAAVVSDKPILGLHHHIGTNSQIVSFVNNSGATNAEAYYLSGSTWTNKALSFTASTKIRAVTFLDYLMAVNGTDSPKSWSGSSGASWGTTNLVSAPTGSLIAVFKDQVYIGSESTDTVYFSSLPSAGAITWSASDNFVVNPNDGSHLRAFANVGQELLFFKNDYIYRFDGVSIQPDPLISYGTPSQEAVTVAAGVCYFYDANRQAILAYSGGYPQVISTAVGAFLRAIPTSSATSVCIRSDIRNVEVFIGDVTVNNVAYTNVALRYNIQLKTWVIRTYSKTFKIFKAYDDGTTKFILGGTSVGDIVKMDTGNDDLGTAIDYDLETPWITLGDNPAVNQNLAGLSVFMENASAVQAFYKTNYDPTWRPIGSCRDYVTSFAGLNAKFHRIKFRFTGVSSAEPEWFDGYSILLPLIEGLEKESPYA